MSASSTIGPPDLHHECARLRRENVTLEAERRQLELKVRVLQLAAVGSQVGAWHTGGADAVRPVRRADPSPDGVAQARAHPQ